LREAADLEDKSGKHVAIEIRLSPMRELLGELLLQANEPALTLKEFESSLRSYPNRYRSFAGAAKAAEGLGDIALARTYYEKPVALVGNAGTERPEFRMAKQFLAAK
jgi:Tfp pilus assembly protein PilF